MAKPGTVEELFEQLVEQFRSEQWKRAIEQLAAGDRRLETQLRELLSVYESAPRGGFLQTPGKGLLKPTETPFSGVSQHSDTTTYETLEQTLDDTRVDLGPYKMRRLLRRGVSTYVYLAEQAGQQIEQASLGNPLMVANRKMG